MNNIGRTVITFDGWGDTGEGLVLREHKSSIDVQLKNGEVVRLRANYEYKKDR